VAQLAGARPGIAQRAPAVNTQQLVSTVTKLLEDRKQLKESVVRAFKHVAGESGKIDMSGLLRVRSELSSKFGIPEQTFGNIQEEYIRFDFTGTGNLEANEVYKLVKWHLYEFLQSNGQQSANNIPMKNLQQAGYTTTKELGAGSQGSVKLACDRHGNQRCVKLYPKTAALNFGGLAQLQDEFETMQLLTCKNIAKTFEIFQDSQYVYMINEVYFGQDLTKVEANANKNRVPITEDWWRGIFRQTFEALSFMQQQAMMHCDIKEPNLMLRTENYADPQVVLIDFGVSKAMTARDDGTCSGTPGYMPPETMNTGKWYPKGDVFSMGVSMMQLLTKMIPDEEQAKRGIMIGIFLEGCRNIDDVKMAVNSRQPPWHKMPAQWGQGLRGLIKRCLEKQVQARPTATTILKDPWFGTSKARKETPVEQAMKPSHPMATVGITGEMMMGIKTQAIVRPKR